MQSAASVGHSMNITDIGKLIHGIYYLAGSSFYVFIVFLKLELCLSID